MAADAQRCRHARAIEALSEKLMPIVRDFTFDATSLRMAVTPS